METNIQDSFGTTPGRERQPFYQRRLPLLPTDSNPLGSLGTKIVLELAGQSVLIWLDNLRYLRGPSCA